MRTQIPKSLTIKSDSLFAGKKGFTVSDMLPLGLTIVVLGIGLSLGLSVLSDFKGDQTVNSNAYNGTAQAEEGLTKFTSYLPTIALDRSDYLVLSSEKIYCCSRYYRNFSEIFIHESYWIS
jgi:type II secretory pathway pseudopilin PulG|tara:strand:- start:107 stop:469 length:363 start_codon:yes stop_codon:yes gene_type:complete